MKSKINEIASKFAALALAVLVGFTAIADITVHKQRKDALYNDDLVVVDVTGGGIDTNDVAVLANRAVETNALTVATTNDLRNLASAVRDMRDKTDLAVYELQQFENTNWTWTADIPALAEILNRNHCRAVRRYPWPDIPDYFAWWISPDPIEGWTVSSEGTGQSEDALDVMIYELAGPDGEYSSAHAHRTSYLLPARTPTPTGDTLATTGGVTSAIASAIAESEDRVEADGTDRQIVRGAKLVESTGVMVWGIGAEFAWNAESAGYASFASESAWAGGLESYDYKRGIEVDGSGEWVLWKKDDADMEVFRSPLVTSIEVVRCGDGSLRDGLSDCSIISTFGTVTTNASYQGKLRAICLTMGSGIVEAYCGINIGQNNEVRGQSGIAIGRDCKARYTESFAIGSACQSLGSRSVAIGKGAVVSANSSFQLGGGENTTANSLQFLNVPVIVDGKLVAPISTSTLVDAIEALDEAGKARVRTALGL